MKANPATTKEQIMYLLKRAGHTNLVKGRRSLYKWYTDASNTMPIVINAAFCKLFIVGKGCNKCFTIHLAKALNILVTYSGEEAILLTYKQVNQIHNISIKRRIEATYLYCVELDNRGETE